MAESLRLKLVSPLYGVISAKSARDVVHNLNTLQSVLFDEHTFIDVSEYASELKEDTSAVQHREPPKAVSLVVEVEDDPEDTPLAEISPVLATAEPIATARRVDLINLYEQDYHSLLLHHLFTKVIATH